MLYECLLPEVIEKKDIWIHSPASSSVVFFLGLKKASDLFCRYVDVVGVLY